MRRDKKLAQKKKARQQAQSSARGASSPAALLAAARIGPFGPAFLSRSWRDDSDPPRLVSALITRVTPDNRYFAQMLLVDRACFGIKSALTKGPLTLEDLQAIVEAVGEAHDGEGMEEVEAPVAQSVAFAALDYAARLGFSPDRDLDERLLGARPDPLVATPLAARPRPFCIPGPDDDLEQVARKLVAAVGADGFDIGELDDGYEDEDDEDDEGDELPGPREADEEELSRAIDLLSRSAEPSAEELAEAVRAFQIARMGHDEPADPANAGVVFAIISSALFRPQADGRTRLDATDPAELGPELVDAVERLRRTRAGLFDVLSVDHEGDVVQCREVASGAELAVRLHSFSDEPTPSERVFAYLTPMADGTWYPPLVVMSNPWLRTVAPEEIASAVDAVLAEVGIADRVDRADPSVAFTRYGAIVSGVLDRLHESAEPIASHDD